MTALASWISKVRRTVSSRLLMPSNVCLPPLEHGFGANPSHAINCLPFLYSAAFSIVATIALAVIGPMPRIASSFFYWLRSPYVFIPNTIKLNLLFLEIKLPQCQLKIVEPCFQPYILLHPNNNQSAENLTSSNRIICVRMRLHKPQAH